MTVFGVELVGDAETRLNIVRTESSNSSRGSFRRGTGSHTVRIGGFRKTALRRIRPAGSRNDHAVVAIADCRGRSCPVFGIRYLTALARIVEAADRTRPCSATALYTATMIGIADAVVDGAASGSPSRSPARRPRTCCRGRWCRRAGRVPNKCRRGPARRSPIATPCRGLPERESVKVNWPFWLFVQVGQALTLISSLSFSPDFSK